MLEASLVILNAHVITLNPEKPTAQAIAILDGKIINVGSNKQIRKRVGKNTRVVHAKGKTVVPGLVDCHVHMTNFGRSLRSLNLRGTKSIKEVQRKLKKYVKDNPEREWVLGRQWDQEQFREKRYPTRWDLDKAVSDKPVFLKRVCGHVAVANSKALQLAGITAETTIERGEADADAKTRQPNGILREKALELVDKAVPKPTEEELKKTCLLACEKAIESGLTCVHWLVDSPEEMRAIQQLHFEKKLPLRVLLGIETEQIDELIRFGLLTGFGDEMLKIGFIKVFADGSLGGHTAALKEPYTDKPERCGMLLKTQAELDELVSKAHSAGLRLGIHAIGDRAVEAVLKAYEKALRSNPRIDHRHRVEHCSVLNPKLIVQMKRLGLVASVQPHFVVSDFWVADRVGKTRARWVYPFKTLVREGLVVVSGSDCPVEPISPILGIWAAVARKSIPEENLTVEEALRTYTINAAYASFDENKRGTIETDKLADLTIMSDNPLTVKPDNTRKTKVEMTIVGGNIVYEGAKGKKTD
jgi:predicted amidohydrolase YtcJ